MRKFGISEKLGIEIPGEKEGFLPSKKWKKDTKGEIWYIGDTYNISIGQGDVLVTPLQINSMTNIIANEGTLYKPHLLNKIIDPQSKEETKIDPTIIRKDIAELDNIRTVKWGMRDCVDYGSCRRLSLLPLNTGAKTGTAQWSSTKDDHAWFTAFAPFENSQISITILIEEGIGGSETAAPVAYDFLKWWGENYLK